MLDRVGLGDTRWSLHPIGQAWWAFPPLEHIMTLIGQTKSNREDGSYASGDLYEKHPTKEAVWRYVGRGDDVIVMVCQIGCSINPADISPMARRRLLVLSSQSFEHRPSLQMLLLSDLNDLSLDSCSSPVATRLSDLYYLLSHLSSTKPIKALHRSRTYLPTCVW